MNRQPLILAVLLMTALACSLPGLESAPTPPPLDAAQTAVAATLTASVPISEPGVTVAAPTETPAPAITDTPPTSPPPSAQCAVAVADGHTVLCQNGADQIQLADAGTLSVNAVAVSSDGTLVAYLASQSDGGSQLWTELWVVNADGSNARKVAGPEQLPASDPAGVNWPRAIQWQAGTHNIFFDTGWTPVGGIQGPGEYINNDLWVVDADTGGLSQMLTPGTGGLFSVSPDGAWVAVSDPDSIGLISADGATTRPDVLAFQPIITYSEYQYKPQVTWGADGSYFIALIPSPDPMAADAGTTLFRVSVDGSTQRLDTLSGGFLFDPSVKPSPDGQWVAYLKNTFDGTNNHLFLQVARTDGSQDSGGETPLGTSLHSWSPDSLWVAYDVHDEGLYVAGFNGVGQLLAQQQVTISFEWTGANSAVFSGQLNGHWGVRAAQVGGASADVAGPFSEFVVFDAR
ncbi:MAG: hypothetical protein FJ030_04115 [Chloroflexi bacterium]|nr:hypothetical protein [Chloroflexota bacterium]